MNNRIKSSNVHLGESYVFDPCKKNSVGFAFNGESANEDHNEKIDEILLKTQEREKVIIQEAESKAAEILQKAEQDVTNKTQEIENLKQQTIESAYAEGFQKGYDEGIEKAKQEVISTVFGLNVLANAAFEVKKEIINSSEKEMLELAITVAEKVIRQQLELKPELLQEIIKAAVEQLSEKEEVKIIVNPVMIKSLYEFVDELEQSVKGLECVKIIEDKTIPKDGVIVESLDSRIDARIETQIREVMKNVMEEYAKRSHVEATPQEIEVRIEDKISEHDESE